jgi:4-alpha-glucanotransferase
VNPASWGIDEGYVDMSGEYRRAPRQTVTAALEAMHATTEQPDAPNVFVVEQEDANAPGVAGWLHLEDGGSLQIDSSLPPDVPVGYHSIEDLKSGDSSPFIVVPRSCYLPPDLFAWGWALQLYALRSESSWGIGDMGSLRRFAHWAAGNDAGFCLLNPLHSPAPHPDQASPYFPGSRVWRNPIYIDLEDVPGWSEHRGALEELGTLGRELNDRRIIDRGEVWRLKETALMSLWRVFDGDDDFDRYCRESGSILDAFAAFVVLADLHGPDWHVWPTDVRKPQQAAVSHVLTDHRDRARFVMWQQWLLDRQLRAAAKELMLVGDVAVGVNSVGFDAWYWQDVFAPGMRVGAPPDDFNLEGQEWGVLAFNPHRLRAAAYEPFALMVRHALRSLGGLRLDHIMGLWRLFWVPDGSSPTEGTYVRYPAKELLGIVALESQRANSIIVGEDLGTVEPHVRSEMSARAMLSYRILYFEDVSPDQLQVDALAAVTNHDLPTLAGLWTGVDLQDQARAGVEPNVDFAARVKMKICELTGVKPDAPVSEVIPAVYERVGRAPSRLVGATLEDGLAVEARPNHPGAAAGYPNWSLALPCSLEEIEAHPGPRQLARLLGNRRQPSDG